MIRPWIIREQQIVEEAEFIVKNCSTVRATAKVFGRSKSSIHYDMTSTLESIDSTLYEKVNDVLQHNKAVRHIRGGNATKEKYQGLK